jgi:hypothetical protein
VATAGRVKRPALRYLLVSVLLVSACVAAWSWLRPYDWRADPAARCRLVAAQVKQDRSYFWLHLHLKLSSGESHDLMKPVRLVTNGGRDIEPADTTLGGTAGEGTTDLWFKFWLETSDFDGPLWLRINDGRLLVRSGSGVPRLGRSGLEVFPSSNW